MSTNFTEAAAQLTAEGYSIEDIASAWDMLAAVDGGDDEGRYPADQLDVIRDQIKAFAEAGE